MIEYHTGNMFDDPSWQCIVHGCNCRGVMGSGLAKEVKSRFPGAFAQYKSDLSDHYHRGPSPLGTISTYSPSPHRTIVSGFTQQTYGWDPACRYASYDAIDSVMRAVRRMAHGRYHTIDIQQIGCHLGGGHWPVVEEIVKNILADFKVRVWTLDLPTRSRYL